VPQPRPEARAVRAPGGLESGIGHESVADRQVQPVQVPRRHLAAEVVDAKSAHFVRRDQADDGGGAEGLHCVKIKAEAALPAEAMVGGQTRAARTVARTRARACAPRA